MRAVRGLPEPAARSPSWQPWPSLAARRRWATWVPVLVAATTAAVVLALRVPAWRAGPGKPSSDVEALDDPTLLSLSDLAGFASPDVERPADLAEDVGPLPELSNEELDALAQLVGVRER